MERCLVGLHQKLMRPRWAGGWEDRVSFCLISLVSNNMQLSHYNTQDTTAWEWAVGMTTA